LKSNHEHNFICTPEDYFIPNPEDKKTIPVDAILCSMGRARSVIDLIYDNGNNGDCFTISHASIMNAIGCLSGILEQAETMILNTFIKGDPK